MAEKNGVLTTFMFVGSVIVGVLGVVALVHSTVYTPLHADQCEEVRNRKSDDATIATNLVNAVNEQKIFNNELLESITEVKTDVKWIRQEIRKAKES